MVKMLDEAVRPYYCKFIKEVRHPCGLASKLYELDKITHGDLEKVERATKWEGNEGGARTLLDLLNGKICVEEFIRALRSQKYHELADCIAGIPGDGVSSKDKGLIGGNQREGSSPAVSYPEQRDGQISPGKEKPDGVTKPITNITNITYNISHCSNFNAGNDNKMFITNQNLDNVDEQSGEYEIVPEPVFQGERREEVQDYSSDVPRDSSCQSNRQSDIHQVSSTITEPQLASTANPADTDLDHLGIRLRSTSVTVDECTEDTEVKQVVACHCNERDESIRSVAEVAQHQQPQLTEVNVSADNEPRASKELTTSSVNCRYDVESVNTLVSELHETSADDSTLFSVTENRSPDELPSRGADNHNRLQLTNSSRMFILLDLLCAVFRLYLTGTK